MKASAPNDAPLTKTRLAISSMVFLPVSAAACAVLLPATPINDRHPEVRATQTSLGSLRKLDCVRASKDERPLTRGSVRAVALRGPRFARAPQGDGDSESFSALLHCALTCRFNFLTSAR